MAEVVAWLWDEHVEQGFKIEFKSVIVIQHYFVGGMLLNE